MAWNKIFNVLEVLALKYEDYLLMMISYLSSSSPFYLYRVSIQLVEVGEHEKQNKEHPYTYR
jgi:hypothetical protein